jgi:hypothetical protein
MGAVNALLHHFATGEVSRAAMARVDHEKLRLAAEIQENVFPHVIGKGQVRPGTKYLGSTHLGNLARYIPFIKSPTDTALVEMTSAFMRVWIGDTLLTRPSVTSTVTNGDFGSSAGWTLTASDGASATISSGFLFLSAPAKGSSAFCERAVTTTSAGTEHALRITVTNGAVRFRCGSSSGAQDYITETVLDAGIHSLAFTPSGTYYPRFMVRTTSALAHVASIEVESAGVVTIAAPWTQPQLPLIRYAQSLDVIYLACANWQQRKIERRGSTGRSWSLAVYQVDDGPFATTDTGNVTMTLGASFGTTTLTASENIFTSSHVGALVRLVPGGHSLTTVLAGQDVYSEPLRVLAVGASSVFAISVTGTWVGTLTLEQSLTGPDDGFAPYVGLSHAVSTTTGNIAENVTPGTTLDNVEFWVRMGFKSGDYTSGTANVAFSFAGGGTPGIVRIVGYANATSVNVQVIKPPGSLNATRNWQFGAWSYAGEWPSAVTLFDGRLWWAGNDKFWGSESDAYTAFNLEDDGDAGSIQRSLATGGTINSVNWMLPLQRLVFGANGAEISARSSSFDEPLTPTNITLKDASTHGCAAISPVKLDNRGIYVHRDGQRLFEVVYELDSSDYRARSLMLFNDDILSFGVEALAVQRTPETYIWAVRSDGQCPVLLYDPAQKSAGWFKCIAAPSLATDAIIEDVVVLPSTSTDRVYFLIRRTINGASVRSLEKLARHSEAIGGSTNLMADAHVFNAGPVVTVTGLSHLEGETVVAWGTTGGVTGPIGTTYTVASGSITLPSSSTNVCVGLKYTWRYKSAKLAYGGEAVSSLLATKRVAEIGLLLENVHPNAISYGQDFTTMYEMPRVENGQTVDETAVRSAYDEASFAFGGDWDTDRRVCLSGEAPYPATLLAISLGMEVNEK